MFRALSPLLLLCACFRSSAAPADDAPESSAPEPLVADAALVCDGLSLDERVAQLLVAYPQTKHSAPVRVGGVIYVGGLLRDLDKARERIADATSRARVPPFFAVDMEGGRFNRMPRHSDLKDMPSARAMAKLSDDEVQAWGARVGRAMRGIGLNMNLAPVLDVASTGHMHSNERAFSGDADVVIAKGRAFARGLRSAGVLPVGKHFPGYGDLADDSDHHLVTSDWPEDHLNAHIRVFREAAPDLGGVMLSNIIYSSRSTVPAILDPGLVKEARGIAGLTITDDLAIDALNAAGGGDPAEVVRKALIAGNDLILTTAPPDWDRGLDYIGILSTYAAEVPEAASAVDAACRRVIQAKIDLGLIK